MRGCDSKNQRLLNSLGHCLMEAEKPMGLIATSAKKTTVPKICFLQPDRVEDSERYSFRFRFMPSSLTNRKLVSTSTDQARLQKPQEDIQELVDGYMGEFLNFHETESSLYFRRTRFGCIGF